MEAVTNAVGWLNGIVWGVPMLVLILGVGLFLTLGLRLLTILKIPFGFKLLWAGRITGGEGEISPFNARNPSRPNEGRSRVTLIVASYHSQFFILDSIILSFLPSICY